MTGPSRFVDTDPAAWTLPGPGKAFADGPPRPGLVPKTGNPEHPGRWVRAGKAAATSEPDAGAGAHTAAPAAAPPADRPDAGLARRAVEAVKRLGSAALNSKVGRVLTAVEHKLALLAHKTREVAAEAGRRRKPPLTEDGIQRLTRVLAVADFVGGSLAGAAIGATVSPIAGKITSTSLPTASALYVAYSAARDPAGTWAAARQVVRDTLSGATRHHAAAGDLADRLAALLGGADADWREALFLAALAETGSAERAAEVAAAAGPVPAELPVATAEDFGGEGG